MPARGLHLVLLILVWALTACVAGGAGPGSGASGSIDRVDALILQAIPDALNWDNKPGPDGFQVQLYFFRVDEPLAIAIRGGELDFLLYQGRVRNAADAGLAPFHVWTYSASELARFSGPKAGGWSYELALGWGAKVPATPGVTLVARYRPAAGTAVYSSPLLLATGR